VQGLPQSKASWPARVTLCSMCTFPEDRHDEGTINSQLTCYRRCLYDHKQHREQQRGPPGGGCTCVTFHASVSKSRSARAQNELRRFNFRRRPLLRKPQIAKSFNITNTQQRDQFSDFCSARFAAFVGHLLLTPVADTCRAASRVGHGSIRRRLVQEF